MLKGILTFLIPSFIKASNKRKRAEDQLYDFLSYIYAAIDEKMIETIFPENKRMLGKAYLIIHFLEKKDPEDFYSFMKNDVMDFLGSLKIKLEYHLHQSNPHGLADSYLEKVRAAIEKVQFIINSDIKNLPDPTFFLDNSEHWQHS